MDDKRIVTIEQVRQFLDGTSEIELVIEAKDERYRWIEETFERFGYPRRREGGQGVVAEIHRES